MTLREAYPALVRALRDAGLDPDRLKPWPAWQVFKESLREPPAPGEQAACVKFGAGPQDNGSWHVMFARQLAVWEPKLTGTAASDDDQDQGTMPELNVVREIVVDLAYDSALAVPVESREIASGDYARFADFIAAVEVDPSFQLAMSAESVASLVYEHEV